VHGLSLDTILAMNTANEAMVGGNVPNAEAFKQLMRAVDSVVTGMKRKFFFFFGGGKVHIKYNIFY
jgi:hypothetical protein